MNRLPHYLTSLLFSTLVSWPLTAVETGPLSAPASELAEGNNTFALDVYRSLAAGEEGNIFISPWSITNAFGMAWAGARGATADEMAEVLHFPFNQNSTHPLFGELIDTINSIQEEGYLVLKTANAIWPASQYTILPEFSDIISQYYQAHAESLDYRDDTEGARLRINGWVADNTEDRIPELIGEGILGQKTSMVLTNAVYFKGAWQTLFDPEETVDGIFLAANGKEIDVRMMKMREDLQFLENDDVTLVTLPYHGEQMEAVLLSPRNGTMEALESMLSLETLEQWLEATVEEEVLVLLPRFSLRYKIELREVLMALGMALPFNPDAADLSGIFGTREHFISKVIHETFLQVKEEGTEAAGATAIIIELTSYHPRPTFNGDRPFLFLIRDTVTGTILFIGRVAEPQPLEEDSGPVDPGTVKEYFGEAATLTDGWWDNTSIGRFRTDGWPWLEHESMGWLYLDLPTAGGNGFWLYDYSLRWLFTSQSLYPNLWCEAEDWLYSLGGTSGSRWFYRYKDGEWVPR